MNRSRSENDGCSPREASEFPKKYCTDHLRGRHPIICEAKSNHLRGDRGSFAGREAITSEATKVASRGEPGRFEGRSGSLRKAMREHFDRKCRHSGANGSIIRPVDGTQ